MYRPGATRSYGGRPGGASKASADTLCQKCLKRGHYSYECTSSAQERPYKARPSRTQQLLNPQLKPKLMMDVPNELLRKKGIADELLAKKDDERGRKSIRDSSHKHSRSVSSSSDSVSTISTNMSRSRSPKRRERSRGASSRGGKLGKRRRRSVSSSASFSNRSEEEAYVDKNTRRRMSSFSPGQRGRRRSRSGSSRMDISQDHARRFRGGKQSRSRSWSSRRNGRRISQRPLTSRSPDAGILDRRRRSVSDVMDRMDISAERESVDRKRRRISRSPSPYRSGPTSSARRGERPRSPYSQRTARRIPDISSRKLSRSPSPYESRNGDIERNGARGGRSLQSDYRRPERDAKVDQPPPHPQQRERSLSPYSKRLALTRTMQSG